ncbi:hypothetical protein Lal_00025652 [Lupinus albus]|nr:hypothetical protein Lal_00025652 [Lupinus albus]
MKYYPKKLQTNTIVDQDGYPIYKSRDNGQTIDKNGVTLDNRHLIPYNRKLVLKYQAHINIECCNQRNSIKYLFKLLLSNCYYYSNRNRIIISSAKYT